MKKLIIVAISLCVLFFGSFFMYTSSARNAIYALGYDENETEKLIEEYGTIGASEKVKDKLNKEIEKKEEVLVEEVGIEPTLMTVSEELSKVEYNEALDTFIDEVTVLYEEKIKEVEENLSKYPVEEELDVEGVSLHQELTMKQKLLFDTEGMYVDKVEGYKAALRDFGVRESELEGLLSGDLVADSILLEEKVGYYEAYNALVSTSGNSYAAGAMDLLAILNNHRVSKGLEPFRYNAEQQGCVDIEANSYANNKNPHNWLCKTLTSEGSSLASINSDYIGIAGHFLTTHGSHEADVVNPNYTSAACSAVARDNMVYMICGYFR